MKRVSERKGEGVDEGKGCEVNLGKIKFVKC